MVVQCTIEADQLATSYFRNGKCLKFQNQNSFFLFPCQAFLICDIRQELRGVVFAMFSAFWEKLTFLSAFLVLVPDLIEGNNLNSD